MSKIKSQKPLDFNQIAYLIANMATGDGNDQLDNKSVHLKRFRFTVRTNTKAKNSKTK